MVAWGNPIAALVGAIALEPLLKTFVWIAALVWMGVACLANARRCARTHCFITGPFFLLMTVPVSLHGLDIYSLGPEGWDWLGLAVAVGGGIFWCLPEMIWGRYIRIRQK
jgi:hypothetical protein